MFISQFSKGECRRRGQKASGPCNLETVTQLPASHTPPLQGPKATNLIAGQNFVFLTKFNHVFLTQTFIVH